MPVFAEIAKRLTADRPYPDGARVSCSFVLPPFKQTGGLWQIGQIGRYTEIMEEAYGGRGI